MIDANKKFQKELNSGTAALVLLSLMDRSAEPMYGYQIAKR
ncbi:MAG: PadR family transcriptional regulator, partial [Candidatus Aminicenantaceae bacterium]